jgi:hypothetical protein
MEQTGLSLNAALRRHNREPSSEKLKSTFSVLDIIEGYGADYCVVSLSMVSLTTCIRSSTGHHLPFKIVSNTPGISFGTTFLPNAVDKSRTTSNATRQPTYHHPSYIVLLGNAIRKQFNRVIISEYLLVQEKCGAELRQISAGIKCPINPPLWLLTCILIMAALTY